MVEMAQVGELVAQRVDEARLLEQPARARVTEADADAAVVVADAVVRVDAVALGIDRERAMLEVLTSIKRAGADVILTYHAREAARLLA